VTAPAVPPADRWQRWRERGRSALASGATRAVAGVAMTAGFAAVFALRMRGDFGELVDGLRDIALAMLIPAVVLNLFDVWCQAVRLRALLRHLSPPPTSRLFAALLIGIMGNNLLPMRMGMVLRAQYLSSRHGFQLASMLSVLVVEGFMDGLVLAALFVPVLVIVGSDTGVFWAVLLSGGVAAGGLIVFRLAYAERWAARFRPLWERLRRAPVPGPMARQFASWASAFAEGVASVRSERSLALAALATAAAWVVTAGVYYTVGRAFSLDLDWTAYLVLTAAINVSGLVQASGGNVGPYEVVATEVIAGFGVPRGTAGAYAIVTHLVRLVPLTIVGLALFAWHTAMPPAPRREEG